MVEILEGEKMIYIVLLIIWFVLGILGTYLGYCSLQKIHNSPSDWVEKVGLIIVTLAGPLNLITVLIMFRNELFGGKNE